MLIDSHCHLDNADLRDEVDAVVARARSGGVGLMLTIAIDSAAFDGVLALTERFADVYGTVGVHPHEAEKNIAIETDYLISHAQPAKIVGIGETGLDYYYDHSPRAIQQASFRAHIAAARATGLPLIIHCRDAEDDTIRILQDEMGQGAFPALIHCFTGTQRLADAALEMGLYLSFSGIITFKKAEELRAVAATIPHDRLLIETDAPFLAPIPKRGQRNEPAYVGYTAAALARIHGVGAGEIARLTAENFLTLFTKVPRPAALDVAA